MMKSFYASRMSAVLGVLLALALIGVVAVAQASAQAEDVPSPTEGTEDTSTICEDITAANYGGQLPCVPQSPTPSETSDTETNTTDETDTSVCEFMGHKYELYETEDGMASRPLKDWVIGLMKVITRGEDGATDYYNLADDLTDANGFYCIDWDGEQGTEDTGIDHETDSFIYRVYEIIKDGWENVSVEMGPDHDSLVVTHDLNVDGVCTDGEDDGIPCIIPEDADFANDGETGVQKIVSIDVSEENGIVIADAAFHVDFYNQQTDDNGGEEEEDTYKVTGYVWEDKNENDTKDSGEENSEQTLADWTVKATQGETVITDTTDANGVYELDLPIGTWTICVELKSEWAHTFPKIEGDCYTVTVPVVEEVTEESTVTGMLMNFFLPTAYAATLDTYTDYNFGVVFKGCVENCGSSNGGGSSGGSSRKHGSKSDKVSDPEGEVLGEATSVLPTGAPDTGMGGTSTSYALTLALVLGMLVSGVLFFRTRHGA